jgi:hypothetical protein
MRKKLRLDRMTLHPLRERALVALRGGRDADDGTGSGYPVCLSYFECPPPPSLSGCPWTMFCPL